MSWDRIRGQDAARQIFQTAFARGRIAHAYLLVGPDGVGKRLFARELTSALLCEKPPAPLTACDHCPGCAQVEARTHPDFHTVRTPPDKHELPVDEIRDFCAKLARKPARGGRVVGIVEDADDFNAESANAFLKTLEEPPAGAILFLIATGTDRQLPTILSRCQPVRFSPLGTADVAAVLAEQGVDDPARRDRLARLSGGSVARALALNDESIDKVREELISGLTADRPNYSRLAATWQEFYEGAGKDTALQRTRVSLVIRFLVEALQQSLRLSLGASVTGLDSAEEARLRAFADRVGTDRVLELIDRCIEADSWIDRRAQLILVIESVLEQFLKPVPS
jgi:DNA polymerase III subunit delta'